MRRLLLALVAIVSCSSAAFAQDREGVETAATEPVEVMIVGSYHFANPGRDAVNIEVDDMLAPVRQREIGVLVDSLALWQPTRVLVEAEADAPVFALSDFADVDQLLATRRNESVQIGYRLARQLGHDAVYGFDEQPGEDEPDYFPMQPMMEFAAANDQSWIVEEILSDVRAQMAELQGDMAEQSVAETLMYHNNGALVEEGHDALYFTMMQVGNGDVQPGAELNAYWFMRNAKMFAKLMMIAEPGDRLMVIVGSGHAGWLRDLTRRTPGFQLVELEPYIRAAVISSELLSD